MVSKERLLLNIMAVLYVSSAAFELKPFADHLTGLRKLSWPLDYAYEGILEGRRVLLAANGEGPRLAAQAVEVALRAVSHAELSSSRLEAVVSTGLCGALDPEIQLRQIVIGEEILEGLAGERLACEMPAEVSEEVAVGTVLSQNRVAATSAEKQTLRESGAIAVDMESSGVAMRARKASLPFYCVKAVSDTASESFRFDLNAMRNAEGRIARGKIVTYSLTHPQTIPALFQLKKRAEDAAQHLGEFLVNCRIAPQTSAEPSA